MAAPERVDELDGELLGDRQGFLGQCVRITCRRLEEVRGRAPPRLRANRPWRSAADVVHCFPGAAKTPAPSLRVQLRVACNTAPTLVAVRFVRGRTTVNLVERALPDDRRDLDVGCGADPLPEVEVRVATAGL